MPSPPDAPPATLAGIPGPAVIVPAGPLAPLPGVFHEGAALRIALLALEQAAWAMQAAAPALNVVASRTEMDWALAQGRTVLWAPSKLVLDTPGAPRTGDPGALASWLAEELGAGALHLHGTVANPADCRVPVRRA